MGNRTRLFSAAAGICLAFIATTHTAAAERPCGWRGNVDSAKAVGPHKVFFCVDGPKRTCWHLDTQRARYSPAPVVAKAKPQKRPKGTHPVRSSTMENGDIELSRDDAGSKVKPHVLKGMMAHGSQLIQWDVGPMVLLQLNQCNDYNSSACVKSWFIDPATLRPVGRRQVWNGVAWSPQHVGGNVFALTPAGLSDTTTYFYNVKTGRRLRTTRWSRPMRRLRRASSSGHRYRIVGTTGGNVAVIPTDDSRPSKFLGDALVFSRRKRPRRARFPVCNKPPYQPTIVVTSANVHTGLPAISANGKMLALPRIETYKRKRPVKAVELIGRGEPSGQTLSPARRGNRRQVARVNAAHALWGFRSIRSTKIAATGPTTVGPVTLTHRPGKYTKFVLRRKGKRPETAGLAGVPVEAIFLSGSPSLIYLRMRLKSGRDFWSASKLP